VFNFAVLQTGPEEKLLYCPTKYYAISLSEFEQNILPSCGKLGASSRAIPTIHGISYIKKYSFVLCFADGLNLNAPGNSFTN